MGLTAAQRKDFEAFTGAFPCVSLDASCETEARKPLASVVGRKLTLCSQGEEGGDILEGDIATCNVHVSLERLASSGKCCVLHASITTLAHPLSFAADAESIHTPFFPAAKEESWWVLLADVSSNTLYAAQKVSTSSQTRRYSINVLSCVRRSPW